MKSKRKYDILEVYDFIVNYKIAYNGNSPSYAEIAEFIGCPSKCTIKRMVDDLHDAGKITLIPGRERFIIIPRGEFTYAED